MLFLNDKIIQLSVSLLLASLFLPLAAHAVDTASSSVLRFQHTMAEKGNAEYQYKLARMYESGTNIERNLDNARHWYELAAKQQYKPAQHRLVYLEIQQHTFKHQHQQWLDLIKREARYNDPEALFLLGQMYAEGLGVEQDFKKSLILLRKASAANITESETEIRRVENLLAEAQARELKEQQLKERQLEEQQLEQQREQRRVAQEQRIIREKQQASQLQQQQLQAKKRKQEEDERRRRQQAVIPVAPKKEPPIQQIAPETSTENICSGHNRFLPTCR